MNKEELKQEAEQYAIKSYGNDAWTQAHIADTEIDCIRMYIVQGYLASAVPREKQIAELKERLKEHESVGNAQFWENVWSWKTKAEQLTKATEIIKKYLAIGVGGKITQNYLDVTKEAEQFLNEVEK